MPKNKCRCEKKSAKQFKFLNLHLHCFTPPKIHLHCLTVTFICHFHTLCTYTFVNKLYKLPN